MNDAAYGVGIVSSANVTLDIQPCPASLILQCASAVKDDSVPTVPVTAGFFAPKSYAVGSTPYYSSTIIAPMLTYDGYDYTFDDPIGSADMQLYVNGSSEGLGNTTDDGLLTFPLTCDFAGSYSTLNLTVVANAASNPLYENKTVTSMVNFTRVSVQDAAAGSSDFGFNYTIYNCNQKTDTIYVGEDPNTIKATVNLFSLPVQNAMVNFSAAERISYNTVSASDYTTVLPNGADLLRVVNITVGVLKPYQLIVAHFGNGQNLSLDSQNCITIPSGAGNVTLVVNPPIGDINKDGIVDIYDAVKLSSVFGLHAGDPMWNSDADLNNDGVIDIYDAIIFARNWGVTNDTAYVDGTLEFFKTSSPAQVQTDNSGVSIEKWDPSDAGTYLIRATLPSNLNVTVNFHSEITQVNACLCAIGYAVVAKRPVCLSVVSPDQSCTQAAPADADTYISPKDDQNHGNDQVLVGGEKAPGGLVYECWGLIQFNISAVPADAYIVSARLNLFGTCSLTGDSGSLGVCTVNSAWNEYNVDWSSCPSFNATPSCTYNFSHCWTDKKWLFLDVTQDVRHWQSNPYENWGLLLAGQNDPSPFLLTLNSREASSNLPALEVTYIMSSPDLVACAYDNVTQKGIGSFPVTINITAYDSTNSYETTTNSSGYTGLTYWYPRSDVTCTVGLSSDEDATYENCSVSTLLDFRFPTNITYGFSNPKNAPANFNYTYDFSVASSALFGLDNVQVKFNISGTGIDGTMYNIYMQTSTISDGSVSVTWAPPQNGTYVINATFGGSDYNMPCQTLVTVNATAKPLAILLNVSPNEFATGTTVVLNATLIDVYSNITFTAPATVEFLDVNSTGQKTLLGACATNGYGTAIWTLQYPDDTAHAYMAMIEPEAGSIVQGIMCNPVQLTVSKSCELLLNVTRDWVSGNQTIEGWLLNATSGISGRRVTITVNDTQYLSSVTNASGYFRLSLNLQAVSNNATTYVVTASFEDNSTAPINATAWATTLNGQQYPACTTIQHGYEPAYNTTTLIVLPESTEVLAMTTSPEEMQKEAQNSGSLRVYSEWSWWYPWYRLHVAINMNGARIDVGFSPILPDIGTRQFHFPSQFLPPIPITIDQTLAQQIAYNTLIGTAAEMFAFAGTAVVAANTHVPGASQIGLAVYAGGLGMLLDYAWSLYSSGNKLGALTALAGFAVNGIGAGLGGVLSLAYQDAASMFVDSIAFPILGAVLSNVVDPQDLIVSIGSSIAILITTLVIGLIILRLIPDPIQAWFYPAFIIASFAFAIIAFNLYELWAK